jgi:hypothetical protein
LYLLILTTATICVTSFLSLSRRYTFITIYIVVVTVKERKSNCNMRSASRLSTNIWSTSQVSLHSRFVYHKISSTVNLRLQTFRLLPLCLLYSLVYYAFSSTVHYRLLIKLVIPCMHNKIIIDQWKTVLLFGLFNKTNHNIIKTNIKITLDIFMQQIIRPHFPLQIALRWPIFLKLAAFKYFILSL